MGKSVSILNFDMRGKGTFNSSPQPLYR